MSKESVFEIFKFYYDVMGNLFGDNQVFGHSLSLGLRKKFEKERRPVFPKRYIGINDSKRSFSLKREGGFWS